MQIPLNETGCKFTNIKDIKGNSTRCKKREKMAQYIINNVDGAK